MEGVRRQGAYLPFEPDCIGQVRAKHGNFLPQGSAGFVIIRQVAANRRHIRVADDGFHDVLWLVAPLGRQDHEANQVNLSGVKAEGGQHAFLKVAKGLKKTTFLGKL